VQEEAADWDREKALNAADAILRAHPDLKAFYAANDGMALGVQQAVNNAGLTGKVLVYGTDAIDDALTSIQAGQMTGTAAQFPFLMGQLEVQACVAAHRGAKMESVTVAPQVLITVDNVADRARWKRKKEEGKRRRCLRKSNQHRPAVQRHHQPNHDVRGNHACLAFRKFPTNSKSSS